MHGDDGEGAIDGGGDCGRGRARAGADSAVEMMMVTYGARARVGLRASRRFTTSARTWRRRWGAGARVVVPH